MNNINKVFHFKANGTSRTVALKEYEKMIKIVGTIYDLHEREVVYLAYIRFMFGGTNEYKEDVK